MVKVIHVTPLLSDEDCARLAGESATHEQIPTLLNEDCDVIRPDGSYLLRYRKRVLNPRHLRAAYPTLLEASKGDPGNRKTALGNKYNTGLATRVDGSVSKMNMARAKDFPELASIGSNAVGAFDRSPQFPYCRLTAYTHANGAQLRNAYPFFHECSALFQHLMPERWAAQMAAIAHTHPDWVLPGTAFTTITVNRNFRTAIHQDAGDLPQGFGVMSVIRAGEYRGGETVFPKWGVGVNLDTGDFVAADVHEWHGNLPLESTGRPYHRIACVFYYRTNLGRCRSAAEELERLKRRKVGDPLYDP